jgi:hypothetical protein
MKTILHNLKHQSARTLACCLAITCLAAAAIASGDSNAVAAGTANAGPAPTGNWTGLSIAFGKKGTREKGYWLPQEVLDKLSPEQLVELEIAHNKIPGGNWSILVPLVPFAAGVLIAGILTWLAQRKNQMMHETLRAMIERGVAIPPELINPPAREHKPQQDLRLGLIFIGIGFGVMLCLLILGESAWGAGFIPLLMGVAFLITWKIEASKNGRN